MQAVAVTGLLITIGNLVRCTAEIELGIASAPSVIFPPQVAFIKGSVATNIQNLFNKTVVLNNANITHNFIFKPYLTQDAYIKSKLTKLAAMPANFSISKPEGIKDTLKPVKKPFLQKLETWIYKMPLWKLFNKDAGKSGRASRTKRQSGFLDIPIPTLRPIYRGPDDPSDVCERDEIMHVDGECHQILSQGPCEDTEFVLMDPDTKKGYCAPRLCNPDRVFVFGDQLCHDPFENDICPPGRKLFTSSVGSPVCGCPYGTYEDEEDLDEDVCKPVLGKIENCGPGQVFWFTSFRREPECLPDPCMGLNANRSEDELPFAPSSFDGKCYQLGKELPQCPSDTFYTLSYKSLSGICASLEDAGYTLLDDEMLDTFASIFGSRLPRDTTVTSFRKSSLSQRSKTPDVGSSVVPSFDSDSNSISMKLGQSAVPNAFTLSIQGSSSFSSSSSSSSSSHSSSSSSSSGDISKENILNFLVIPTHASAFSPSSIILKTDNSTQLAELFQKFKQAKKASDEESEETEEQRLNGGRGREKRNILPHASPDTVFQSTLASCRAGGEIGINFKCNTKYLPNRLPLSRPRRSIAPIIPYPSCPKGSFYSIKRTCVSNESKVRSSLIASGLG